MYMYIYICTYTYDKRLLFINDTVPNLLLLKVERDDSEEDDLFVICDNARQVRYYKSSTKVQLLTQLLVQ
jgi:hypothetical protein